MDPGLSGTRALVAKIGRALRLERRRGRGGHGDYDLQRHAVLGAALHCELLALAGRSGPDDRQEKRRRERRLSTRIEAGAGETAGTA